jgi:hypothetical protein
MGYCGNCGHPLDEDSGFCSYCGAEHSADGEIALPARPGTDSGAAGTMPLPPQPEGTLPMVAQLGPTVPRVRIDTVTAQSTPQPPDGHGRSSGRRWMLVVAIVVILAACASVVAMVLLRDRGSAADTAALSPSPSPTVLAVVKIMSPRNGNKVIGGQAMRVAVIATDVLDVQGLRLTVNGEPTGAMKLGTGPDDSKTVSFPWRPPAKGGDIVLGAEAVLQDGSVVPSKAVRVSVRPAVVPTPTVTVTAQPAPSYESSGSTGDGSPTDFWAAMMCSKTELAEAEDWAARARAAGFTNVHILRSSGYGSLNPGYWCAYLGPYGSRSSANAAVSDLYDSGLGGDDPYPSHVYD